MILEAMAAGKAVVGFDVGGIGEIIRHDQTGILINPFDKDVMIKSIIELLDNPQKRERFGTEARRVAVEYSWSHIADQYLELYQPGGPG